MGPGLAETENQEGIMNMNIRLLSFLSHSKLEVMPTQITNEVILSLIKGLVILHGIDFMQVKDWLGV